MRTIENLLQDEEIEIKDLDFLENIVKPKASEEMQVIVLKKSPSDSIDGFFCYEIGVCFSPEDNIPEKLQEKIDDQVYHHIGKTFSTEVIATPGQVLAITWNTLNLYKDANTDEEYLKLYESSVREVCAESDQPDTFKNAIEVGQISGLLIHKDAVKNLDLVYPVPLEVIKNFDPEYRRGEQFDPGYIELDKIPEGIGEGRFIWFDIEDSKETDVKKNDGGSEMNYDSTQDTLNHIKEVETLMKEMVRQLLDRASKHDLSKLKSPEKEAFDEYTPKLKNTTYGSEQYKKYLREMSDSVKHHYSKNSHHPEHYKSGIGEMDLIDLIEMICDWKAATLRHKDGNMAKSLEQNQKRFGIENQLMGILSKTIKNYVK